MEEDFAKLEANLMGQLERTQKELEDSMIKSQQDMMKQIAHLMGLRKVKDQQRKCSVEDPPGPPVFIVNPSRPLQGVVTSSLQACASTQALPGVTFTNMEGLGDDIPDFDELEKLKVEFSKQLEKTKNEFEEKLQIKEDEEEWYGLNASELSLVSGLEIPYKFKTPDFERFDGPTCPIAHITMFCRKMAGFTNNEKLLIHYFQDSLVGSATRWYNQLTRAQIKSWKDLAKAFTNQYKHVTDMIPNRLMLQGMEQGHNESLREYARRWRDAAAQVQPPLNESELSQMFVDTLEGVLYDRLISHPISSFAELVMTGERIEYAIKKGKMKDPYSIISQKEEDSHVYVVSSHSTNQTQGRPHTHTRPTKVLHPIPMTYTKLLPILVEKKLLTLVQSKPKDPPYPEGYNVNATCDYHMGSTGHTTENCGALRNKVQGLIEAGILKF